MDWQERKKGFSPRNPQLSLEGNRENKRGWGARRGSSLRWPEVLGEMLLFFKGGRSVHAEGPRWWWEGLGGQMNKGEKRRKKG